jgi:hypothetical protein
MRVCWLMVVTVVSVVSAPTSAQERWAFIPVKTGGAEVGTPLLTKLESALADIPIMTNHAAATTVEARHSSETPHLDDQEIKRALDIVKRATSLIGEGDEKREGLKLLRELEKLAAPVKDYIQRDAKRSERLFHACVLAGGLLLKTKQQESEAHEQLRMCARTYPGRKAKGEPKTVAAFTAAATEIAAEPHGTLDVEGGTGCNVRLNGTLIGPSPQHMDAVRVGTARVQMECGDAARLHGVKIEPGANRLVIDAELEQALSTSADQLSLRYADDAQRERSLSRHGHLLSDVIAAHIVALISSGSRVRVVSLEPRAELGTLSDDDPPAALRSLGQRLKTLAPATPSPPAPATSVDTQPPASEPAELPAAELTARERVSGPVLPRDDDGKSTAQIIASGALIAAGVSSWIAAWVFYGQRVSTRNTPTTGLSYDARRDFRSAGTVALSLAAGGSIALTAAEYVLLPQERGVPTAAWAWFGAGVLLAGSGVALMAAELDCTLPSAQCRGLTQDITFGAMLALHSLPLLAVPLNFALHDWLRPVRRIELGLGGTQASITYRF